jgi:hypothetical protein
VYHVLGGCFWWEGIAVADRYCGNCGGELEPEDSSCAGCGRPVHKTADAPMPQANGRVPHAQAPVRSQRERGRGAAQDSTGGPILGMLVAFFVLVTGETAQRIPPAASGGTFASRLGVGVALPLALALLLVALILLLGGVYYAIARKDGVTFRGAVFNWPMVSTAVGIVVVFLLG